MLIKYKIGEEELVLETDYYYMKDSDDLYKALGINFGSTKMWVIKDSNLVIADHEIQPLTKKDLENLVINKNSIILE
jgi:hypothetical protein